MHILIDIGIILIIAGAVWVGYKKGFILGLCGILAIVISFYGANLVSTTYYEEFTPVLEPFVGGIVEDAVQQTIDPNDGESDSKNESHSFTGDINSREGVYNVAFLTLSRVGIADDSAAKTAEEIADSVERVGPDFKTMLTSKLCKMITRVLSFVIVFLLLMIVFTVISNILNLQLRVPGFDLVNNIGGAVVGLAKAWFIVALIAFVVRYAGMIVSDTLVRKTVLLELFVEKNLVASILGL